MKFNKLQPCLGKLLPEIHRPAEEDGDGDDSGAEEIVLDQGEDSSSED